MGLLGRYTFESEEGKKAFSQDKKKSKKISRKKKKSLKKFSTSARKLATSIGSSKVKVKGYSSRQLRRL